jgi:hypothetical protein
MHAVVKLKKYEDNRSGHSRPELSARTEDISFSDNLSTAPENSKPQLFESFSFIKMLSSYHSHARDKASDHISEFNPHNSVAKLSTHLQPQLTSHLTSLSPKSQSVKTTIHKLSQSTAKPLENGPLFFLPNLHDVLSKHPLLSLSFDDPVSTEKCPEVDSSQQRKETEEYPYVVQSSHKSPLLIKEQDIINLAKHQHALWSWSKNIHKHCWTDITSLCSEEDSLNDIVSCTSEQVKVRSTNELLKQTPVDEGAIVNSDSDGKVLQQVVKLLTAPKRTIITQVDLVGDVLQGSEHVATENETENRYIDLVSALQRIMLRVSKNENTA